MPNPILYVDMDNVIVDFQSGIDRLDDAVKERYAEDLDEVPGIFSLMKPMPGAIQAIHELSKAYDLYILSTAPWLNPSAWVHKIQWIHDYFGKEEDSPVYKRLIISHHKDLNRGDFLIDDRPNNGADSFQGEWIHFGSPAFENWTAVLDHLLPAK